MTNLEADVRMDGYPNPISLCTGLGGSRIGSSVKAAGIEIIRMHPEPRVEQLARAAVAQDKIPLTGVLACDL